MAAFVFLLSLWLPLFYYLLKMLNETAYWTIFIVLSTKDSLLEICSIAYEAPTNTQYSKIKYFNAPKPLVLQNLIIIV